MTLLQFIIPRPLAAEVSFFNLFNLIYITIVKNENYKN